MSSPNFIQRKAVDVSGQLGSLYDASSDTLLKCYRVKKLENTQFYKDSICQVFQGTQVNNVIHLLKAIKFDDALLQSILLGMVRPFGISSVINYNQPINNNTHFLYHSYICRTDKLSVTAEKIYQNISLPSDLNNATHMITEIIYGFEVLCVIQVPTTESSVQIEDLLNRISKQLQSSDKPLKLTDKEERQINELSNVTIYASEICCNDLNIDELLNRHFSKENNSVILWYSSDRLKRENSHRWTQIYEKITAQRQQATQQISLIYVDFSQFSRNLEDFHVKNLPIQSSSDTRRRHRRAHPLPSNPQEQPSLTSSPSSVTEINVLLMGETGVGKSTFINAFVNYLIFDTLEQAQQNDPVVLIPVSFLITTGDQFNEFIVKFGDIDSNENHEHQGQSVTQQCKSYIFKLNEKLCLRLIDTPGMGDTRGLVQDEKNIDHILTYVNNLSHLNAICLLFKPNESRLNMFFSSCINQLLMYLTPIFYNNIIFCFTNARSTFFAPGNTGSLLREIFKQEHLKDIPFEKKNTFCFDSESFRYLAAKKCGVEFDEFVKQESINSWTTSVTESIRLLHFILKLKPYDLNEWQSIRKASLEISILARPLMEKLRLILYNWKLRGTGTVTEGIVLNSNFVRTESCSNCAQTFNCILIMDISSTDFIKL
ncbi:unnamed protein product [Rotaria sordida]|uniref:Septin-type G domain-containing protein n=1 Tax=Rotaria sordida TaxID=392033 RepID=A0A814RH06_9BILA|nr:unnamed protein product [Rotaria sordida]